MINDVVRDGTLVREAKDVASDEWCSMDEREVVIAQVEWRNENGGKCALKVARGSP